MTRFYFIYFPLILFFYFSTNAQNDLVLEKVSVENSKIVLSWKYNPNAEGEYITIYRCTGCENPDNAPTYDTKLMDENDLTWEDPAALGTIHYFYGIAWALSSIESTIQNNMVLKAEVSEVCRNAVVLSWNPYLNMNDTISWYKILYKEKGATHFLRDSVLGVHYTFRDKPERIKHTLPYLESNTEYEFIVQAVSKNSSICNSNRVSLTTGFEDVTTEILEITTVSVIDDKFIEVAVNIETPFESLLLLRAKPSSGTLVFETIEKITEYIPDSKLYLFQDFDVFPKTGLYYYKVVANYDCARSDTSNTLSNIYLYGTRIDKYEDFINFKQVGLPPVPASEIFELFRFIFNDKISITNTLSIENNSYSFNVLSFMHDGAAMKYVVRSERGSLSNTVIVDHEPLVEFPNAFYPDGGDIVNKTFYPLIKFPSEENYLFIIYNRLGQELYRSTLPPVYGEYHNFQGRWDGTFQGKNCPPEFYAFQIQYTFNEGSGKFSKSGTFMLVR